MSMGRIFFRDLNVLMNGRRQFVMVGKIWLPADTEFKGEHIYTVVGHETATEGMSCCRLETLFNSAEDVTNASRKADPNKVLRLIKLP